jgi:hypothetical protein
LDKNIAALFAAEIDDLTLMLQVDGLLTRDKGMTHRIFDEYIADLGVTVRRSRFLLDFPPSFQAPDQQPIGDKYQYGKDDKPKHNFLSLPAYKE